MTILHENSLENNREMKKIKAELCEIYNECAKKQINKMRSLEMDDHVYDLQKLQREQRYEGQSKIKEIKINDRVYSGTKLVIEQYKMK